MVVVDNNVLSSLAKIQRLDYLPQIFDDVGTVSSVFDELHRDAVAGYEFVRVNYEGVAISNTMVTLVPR